MNWHSDTRILQSYSHLKHRACLYRLRVLNPFIEGGVYSIAPQFPHNKSYCLGVSTWQHQKRPLTDSFRLYEALLPATRNRTLSATPIISEGVWSYLFSSIWYLSPWGWKQEGFTPDWLNIRVKIDDSPRGWKTHLEKIYLKTHWLGAIHSARWVIITKK